MNRTVLLALAMAGGAAALLAVVLLGGDSAQAPASPARVAAAPTQHAVAEEEGWEEPAQPRKAPQDPRLAVPQDDGPREPPPPTPRYKAQSDEDKKRLGDAAYAQMETLWVRGRHPRAHPDAMNAMEQLLERYPDTHRAGCARYELAQHHLKNGRVPPSERIKAAEPLLTAARDRHVNTRCESDVSAGNLAALALAMEVYRHSDRRLATSILDGLSGLPATETDRLGKPLAEKARFLKEHLPPGLENPDTSAPPPETPGK